MTTGRRPHLRTRIRILAVVPVLASLTAVGSLTKAGPSLLGCAQASSIHHAALVAEHGDGTVITVCVPFTEDSITGDQLLARSHVNYATAGFGSTGKAVCQIDDEPAQYPPSCWTASSPYWAMSVSRAGGSWATSSLGISSQTFRDGDAEGFRYEGQGDYSFPPSPSGVCPVPSSPSPAQTPAATPAPRSGKAPAGPISSSQPARTPAAIASATPSFAVLQPSSPAEPSRSATARPSVIARSANPPVMSAGGWAASALGAVLLVLLVVQALRPRRRTAPPRWQP